MCLALCVVRKQFYTFDFLKTPRLFVTIFGMKHFYGKKILIYEIHGFITSSPHRRGQYAKKDQLRAFQKISKDFQKSSLLSTSYHLYFSSPHKNGTEIDLIWKLHYKQN